MLPRSRGLAWEICLKYGWNVQRVVELSARMHRDLMSDEHGCGQAGLWLQSETVLMAQSVVT